MKKIMSFLTIVTMLSNSALANTPTIDHTQMISNAFNEFRYKMTVDVNPDDSQFQEKAANDFKQRMVILESKGVSSEEIMDYMRSSMLDISARGDFDRMLSSIDINKVSSEEAGNLAMRFMANKYQQQGASYSGGGKPNYKVALIIIGVVIIGVVTYLVIKHIQDQKAKTNTETITKTNTDTVTKVETKTDTLTKTDVQTSTETVTHVDTVTQTTVLTHTETLNNTETVTSYETVVKTNTVTNYETLTNTSTVTSYQTVTNTYTDTLTNTVTDTLTNTITDTITNTITNTVTDTGTEPIGVCCNGASGHIVSASYTGCLNGVALYWVSNADACVKLGPPGQNSLF